MNRGRALLQAGRRHPGGLRRGRPGLPLPELHARPGGPRAAWRPQSGILRSAAPAAANHPVHLAKRPGALRRLPAVLPGPRAGAPVLGTGRRLEELPRAVDQRGVRAVLRAAVRRAPRRAWRAAGRHWPACATPPSSASGQGPITLGYRLGHIKGDSRVFRAVVYNKGAMVLHMLRRLIGDDAFFDGLRRFYRDVAVHEGRAPTRRARPSSRPRAARWTRSSSGGSTSSPSREIRYAADHRRRRRNARMTFQAGRRADFELPVTVTVRYADGSIGGRAGARDGRPPGARGADPGRAARAGPVNEDRGALAISGS